MNIKKTKCTNEQQENNIGAHVGETVTVWLVFNFLMYMQPKSVHHV